MDIHVYTMYVYKHVYLYTQSTCMYVHVFIDKDTCTCTCRNMYVQVVWTTSEKMWPCLNKPIYITQTCETTSIVWYKIHVLFGGEVNYLVEKLIIW